MPLIKYFEIMKEVIRENMQSITQQRNLSGQETYEVVVKYLHDNSNQWTSGRQPVICYDDPLCRIAYLYGIVSANANLAESIFNEDREVSQYFDDLVNSKGCIKICAFGGGPGTEMIGIIKSVELKRYLAHKFPIFLDFLILDRVKEWIDSWFAIKREIERRFENNIGTDRNKWPVIFSGNFCSVDITNMSNFGNLGNLYNHDFYILSYVLSEIFDESEEFITFLGNMVNYSPRGSKFIFIDRRGPRWEDRVRLISEQVGLELSELRHSKSNMSSDEQVTDLGELVDDVGRRPRLTWDAFWVVGTKR